MIRVLYYSNPLDCLSVQEEVVPWFEGMTAADAVPTRLRKYGELVIMRDGQPLELTAALVENDKIALTHRPGGAEVAVAVQLFGSTLFTFTTTQGVLMLGYAAAIYAAGRLLAPPKPGKSRSDEGSPVYGFSGPGNVRVEGQPIPIIYGRFRYPGTIINEYTRTRAAPYETDYYALVSFGEGPIYSIAGLTSDTSRASPIRSGDATFPTGVQLNGNDASSFDGVALAVRMGTPEQDVVSGDELAFSDTEQVAAVGSTLTSTETATQDNSAVAFDISTYTGAAANTHFASYSAGYSFTDSYDRFRVVVSFPGGLYRITSTGNVVNTYGNFACRYIELDGGGSPIASGGPEGDGYVRLPPEARIAAAQRNPFAFEFEHVFYDPQTYTHPTVGRALVLDRTTAPDHGIKSTPNVPTLWATANANVDGMSVGFWVNPDDVTGGVVFSWLNGSSDQGIEIALAVDTAGTGLYAALRIGNDTSTLSYNSSAASGSIAPSTWSYVAVTYQGNYNGSSDRLRIYYNGAKVYENTSSNIRMRSPGTGTAFYVGRRDPTGSGTVGFDGLIDALELDNREWISSDIALRYQTGQGYYIGPTATHVGLWQFDTTSGASATDSSARANTLTLVNGANIPVAANGKVLGSPSLNNTPKFGRYKVEVVRVNNDSTHPNVSDEAEWSQIVGIVDEEFSYPSSPLLALKVKATEQLNTSVPTITTLIEGRIVPIWDGLSTRSPTFYQAWSRNPSWIALDLILDKRYGLGEWYGPTDVDVQSFQDFADYADELIYDLQGVFDGGSGLDWTDLTYTGTAGVGTIVMAFGTAYDSLKWEVGDYVGFEGVPVVGGGADINTVDTGGYEITAMDSIANTVTLSVSLASDPWTSGTALSAHATVDGTAEGREPRFCFDGALDEERPAWESLCAVLATGLAVPVREGKRIRVKYEHPRDALDIIGQGSIVEGSFEVTYGGRKGRPNSITAEFLDEDQNYDRTTHHVDHPSIQNTTTLDGLRRESQFLLGIVRRSQAARHAAFLLNVNNDLVRTGRFRAAVDAIGYEVGDVYVLSHDVTQWGESGRVYASNTTSAVKLDRDVTLAPATTYSLLVRNSATGQYETRTVSSAAATYTMGTAISVSVAFTFTPQSDDPYILVVSGAETLVQITSITLGPDLIRDIEWMEYSDSTYAFTWLPDVDGPSASSTPAPNPLIMPGDAGDVTLEERVVRGPGNSFETHLQVGWSQHPEDDGAIESTAIYVSIDDGPFEHVTTVPGKQSSADVKLDRTEAGSRAVVSIQPRTVKGVRRRPEACANAAIIMQGVSLPPSDPSGFTAKMDGELAVYSFTAADDSAHHEIRRGGWILGQVVATVPPGRTQTSPIANWAALYATTRTSNPPTYVRARNGAGFYSGADRITRSLAPSGLREQLDWITAGSVTWEFYADGWRTASSPPAGDPTITGFTVVDDDTHGDHLIFDGSSLTATYETAYTAPSFSLTTNAKVSRAYVEAWYVAEQSYPITAAEMDWPVGAPGYERWLGEGPMTVLSGEDANCTLVAQINYHDGDAWSGWQEVVSGGVYNLTDAKFRLVATRPSTSSNLRIWRFVTRIRLQSETNNERTMLQAMLTKDVFGYG